MSGHRGNPNGKDSWPINLPRELATVPQTERVTVELRALIQRNHQSGGPLVVPAMNAAALNAANAAGACVDALYGSDIIRRRAMSHDPQREQVIARFGAFSMNRHAENGIIRDVGGVLAAVDNTSCNS